MEIINVTLLPMRITKYNTIEKRANLFDKYGWPLRGAASRMPGPDIFLFLFMLSFFNSSSPYV